MRNLIGFSLILLILSSGNVLFAQRALYKPQTHEVGLQLGAINFIPTLSNYYDPLPVTLVPLSGLAYTYHHSISDGFRLRFMRKNGKYLLSPDNPDFNADRNDWDIRLGYMRKYHKGAGQFYAGGEAIYRMGKLYEYQVGTERPDQATDEFSHMGGAIFAGYRHFFNTHLSASFELGGYYTRTIEPYPTRGPNDDRTYVFWMKNGEFGLDGSISLNFHFVKMKKRCTCPKVRM